MVDLRYIRPADLWYTVGLIATDGNLSSDGRHINITSKDKNLLETVRSGLHLRSKLAKKSRGREKHKKYSMLQFSDVEFYRYLLSIGLKPKKSLTLEKIRVPHKYFIDFIRGIIDGDGTISTWKHRTNSYTQWSLRIFSGSPIFSGWLKNNIETYFRVNGRIYTLDKPGKNKLYTIKFGKLAAKEILKKCYYKNALALKRKNFKALKCLATENGLSKYGDVISLMLG